MVSTMAGQAMMGTFSPPNTKTVDEALDIIARQTGTRPSPRTAYRTYDPSVEQWRQVLYDTIPDSLKDRADELIDKALWVIDGESGGQEIYGDGGAAWGAFQSHYIKPGSSRKDQALDAWRLIAKNPDVWTDWGEGGVTYNGQPFGALGRNPYPGMGRVGDPVPVNYRQAQIAPVAFHQGPQETQPDQFGSGIPGLLGTAVRGSLPGLSTEQGNAAFDQIANLPEWMKSGIRGDTTLPDRLARKAVSPIGGPVGDVLAGAQDVAGDVGAAVLPSTLAGQTIDAIHKGTAAIGLSTPSASDVGRFMGESNVPRSPLDIALTAAPVAGGVAKAGPEAAARIAASEAVSRALGDTGILAERRAGAALARATGRNPLEGARLAPRLAGAATEAESLKSVLATAQNRSVADLRRIAEDRGLDVSAARTKKDVIAVLQEAAKAEGNTPVSIRSTAVRGSHDLPAPSEVVRYEDTIPVRKVGTQDAVDWSEAEIARAARHNRLSELTPPQVRDFPTGTLAQSAHYDPAELGPEWNTLSQLQEFKLNDPILHFTEAQNPRDPAIVQKYVDWIKQGSTPPPLRGVQVRDDNGALKSINITDGEHRARALRQALGDDARIKVWVDLTDPQNTMRGVTADKLAQAGSRYTLPSTSVPPTRIHADTAAGEGGIGGDYTVGEYRIRVEGAGNQFEVSIERNGARDFTGRNAGGSVSGLRDVQTFIQDMRARNPGTDFIAYPTDARRATVYGRAGFEDAPDLVNPDVEGLGATRPMRLRQTKREVIDLLRIKASAEEPVRLPVPDYLPALDPETQRIRDGITGSAREQVQKLNALIKSGDVTPRQATDIRESILEGAKVRNAEIYRQRPQSVEGSPPVQTSDLAAASARERPFIERAIASAANGGADRYVISSPQGREPYSIVVRPPSTPKNYSSFWRVTAGGEVQRITVPKFGSDKEQLAWLKSLQEQGWGFGYPNKGASPSPLTPTSSRYTPEQIASLRQDIRNNIQSFREGGTGNLGRDAMLSPDEVKQQIREGLIGNETPHSTLQAYLEDPSSREVGDLEAALKHVNVSRGEKADLAKQLQASLDALRKQVQTGEVSKEAAGNVEVVVRRNPRGKLTVVAKPGEEPSALEKAIDREVRGLSQPKIEFPSDTLPGAQPDLFGNPVQPGFGEARLVTPANPLPARTPQEMQSELANARLRSAAERAGQPLGAGGAPPTTPPGGPRVPQQPNFGPQWQPGRDIGGTIRNAVFDFVTLLPRVAQTALDHSSILRQGGLLIRRQKEFIPNIIKSTRGMFDEEYALARQAEIEAAPYNPRTLQLTKWKTDTGASIGERLSEREEGFVSRWADKIPGIKQSQRAAALFLNGMRSDVSNTFARTMLRQGMSPTDPEFLQNLDIFGNYMNRVTGRGNLGRFEESVGLLNQVFYSARRNVGMVQAPFYVFSKSAAVRKEAFLDIVGFVATGMATLELAKAAGADVGTNPSSADFGKIKVGNTRVDIWGGYQQMARLIYRVGDGVVKDPNDPQVQNVIFDFLRNKLSPQASLVVDWKAGSNAIGERFGAPDDTTGIDTGSGIGNEALKRVLPLAWGGLVEAVRDDGLRGLGLSATGLLGTGTQTYESQPDLRDQTTKQLGFGDSFEALNDYGQRKAVLDAIKASGKGYPPSEEQRAAETVREGFKQDQSNIERAFMAGQLTEKYADAIGHIKDQRIGSAKLQSAFLDEAGYAPQSEFAKRFSNLIDGYRAAGDRAKDEFGQTDFDALKREQNSYIAGLNDRDQQLFKSYLAYNESLKSDIEKRYDKYRNDREAAGYFQLNADTAKLDKANPRLDVEGWFFGGGLKRRPDGKDSTPTLQTSQAVDMALGMNLPNRPVKLQGVARPINESQQSRQAWEVTKQTLPWYLGDGGLLQENWATEAARLYKVTKDEGYNVRSLDQMDAAHRGAIKSNLTETVRKQSGFLDGWLLWWGITDSLKSQAGADYYGTQILPKYGKRYVKAQ